MATKIQLLQEAERRGLLSPDKIALLREAERRGLAEEPSFAQKAVEKTGEFLGELGPGLGELGAGAFQLGAELAGREDIARKVGEQVAKEREQLTEAQKAGRVAGQIIPAIATGGTSLPAIGASGAGLAALQPTEEGTLGARTAETIKGGLTSLATAGALKLLGTGAKALGSKVVSKFDEVFGSGEVEKPITSAIIKSRSSKLFKEARDKGGVLKQSFNKKFLESARKELAEESRVGEILNKDSVTFKALDKLNQVRNETFDLQGIQATDRFLSSKILDATTPRGTITDEGLKLLKVQNSLRRQLDKIRPQDIQGGKEGFEALKKAKNLWKKSIKLSEIETILEKARYVDNPSQTIRAGFRALANNPKRLMGFTKEEVKLIKQAAETGVVTDAIKTLGGRLIPIGAVVSGQGVGKVAAAQATAATSREIAKLAQGRRAQKVIEEIVSPVGTRLPTDTRNKRIFDLLTKGTALTTTNF